MAGNISCTFVRIESTIKRVGGVAIVAESLVKGEEINALIKLLRSMNRSLNECFRWRVGSYHSKKKNNDCSERNEKGPIRHPLIRGTRWHREESNEGNPLNCHRSQMATILDGRTYNDTSNTSDTHVLQRIHFPLLCRMQNLVE